METKTIYREDLTTIFASQRNTALRIKNSSAAERIARIVKLKDELQITLI